MHSTSQYPGRGAQPFPQRPQQQQPAAPFGQQPYNQQDQAWYSAQQGYPQWQGYQQQHNYHEYQYQQPQQQQQWGWGWNQQRYGNSAAYPQYGYQRHEYNRYNGYPNSWPMGSTREDVPGY